jgi:hypothetical protein
MSRNTSLFLCRAALGALGALLALAQAPAHASQPALFHSPGDTGQDPGTLVPPLQPGGSHTLYLYLHPGSVASSGGCNASTCGGSGTGDETCGLNFEVLVDGDLELTGFSSSFGQLSSMLDDVDDNGVDETLRVAIVTTNPPICAQQATRLGTLTLTSGTAGGTVELKKLETADADLELKSGVAPRDLAFIPEPGAWQQLAAGAVALAALARRRARRGGVR